MIFTRYQLFRWALIAFLIGVAFSYLGIYETGDALVLLGCAFVTIICGRKNRTLVCIGVISFFFFFGVARALVYEHTHAAQLSYTPITFSGTIIRQSFLPDGRQNILIRFEQGGDSGQGVMRMHLQSMPLYHVDDQVAGTCVALYSSLNTQSTQLQFYRIPPLCRGGSLESVRMPSFFGVRIMRTFKDWIGEALHRGLPSPESDLLEGLLIGNQTGASRAFVDIFRRAGISHIVAISGYNISLVIAAMWSVLRCSPFGRRKSMWILAGGTIMFVIVTGASPSSVRAAIMGIAVLCAQYLGRSSQTITTLLFTAVLMVVFDPGLVLFNVGFQLSFLATLGIVVLVPLLTVGEWPPPLWGLRDIAFQSVAATLFTQPVIFYTFHTVSVVGLAANMAILPVIPIIMILGFGWSTLAMFALIGDHFPPFSLHGIVTLFGLPLYGFLAYVVSAATWFATMPFAVIHIPSAEWIPLAVCAWYGTLWWSIDALRRRVQRVQGLDSSL